MLAFKGNPYTWDASSKGIKSSVIDFSLKAANGSSLEVSGLSKPVELFIPQNEESGEKENTSTPVFFVKPSDGSNNMRWQFLLFYVSVVRLCFTKLNAFFVQGLFPSFLLFLWYLTLCNFYCAGNATVICHAFKH